MEVKFIQLDTVGSRGVERRGREVGGVQYTGISGSIGNAIYCKSRAISLDLKVITEETHNYTETEMGFGLDVLSKSSCYVHLN